LNRYFYTEAPDLASPSTGPNCTTGEEYDPPIIVDQVNIRLSSVVNVYNSSSCGDYTTTNMQNLCVPNFLHLSDSTQKPFKCIHIPTPDKNVEYVYENYYGMYNEVSGSPVNDNLPNYFKQTPDKKVTLTIPSYAPTPYPKPINVPGSVKEENFWNSTIFIILAVVISAIILIVAIVLIVKFSKKPIPYESTKVRYTS
jgi:hypothetical protein